MLVLLVQVYEPGKGLAFHFDKDEHAMKERHEMIQPVLSSVLYLTGDAIQGRLGAPNDVTLIHSAQRYPSAMLPFSSPRCVSEVPVTGSPLHSVRHQIKPFQEYVYPRTHIYI